MTVVGAMVGLFVSVVVVTSDTTKLEKSVDELCGTFWWSVVGRVRYVACGVWRVACGVWRAACGAWRAACGVSHCVICGARRKRVTCDV